jgi:hypothetical protein
MTSRGVLYVAFGDRYQEEARRSIGTLRRSSPGTSCAVITDSEWAADPRPDSFVLRPRDASFGSKPRLMYGSSPYDETLFLDTDTVVVRDVAALFGLLRWYDLGVKFAGPQLNEADGLEYHTQTSSGVILFRKCDEVRHAFELWLAEFERASAEVLDVVDLRGLGDQRYFAVAIARSRARPVHLDDFVLFNLAEATLTYSPPMIVHGRLPELEEIANRMVSGWDPVKDWRPRFWLPDIRGFLPLRIRRADPLLFLAYGVRRLANRIRGLLDVRHRRR